MIQTRDLSPDANEEIALVAERMRATLIEVEGLEEGSNLYTLDWLRDRVRWHLDRSNTNGRVVLAVEDDGTIVGHTILRMENGDGAFGLVSTTSVIPAARRRGVATTLLALAETWFRSQGAGACGTWTSPTNAPLIELYVRHGYHQVDEGPNDLNAAPMVKLAKPLLS